MMNMYAPLLKIVNALKVSTKTQKTHVRKKNFIMQKATNAL